MADVKPLVKGADIPKFRIVVLGNSKTGKTSLLSQYISNCFRESYYPTKEFTFYKLTFNFNPDMGELDEYAYVELLDTIGVDRGKKIDYIKEFYNNTIINERDINQTSTKINERLKKLIKYDYSATDKEDMLSDRGLFSHDKVMAFICVFDYNDPSSFLAVSII